MVINDELLEVLIEESRGNQRKRKNYNFHKQDEDPLQRMLNVIQADSYIRPHKHENPDKREAFILIKGRLMVVVFDESGEVAECVILDCNAGVYGYEIQSGIYHSIVALEDNTVVYEVKDGPYNPADDKCFAPWSPTESNEKEALQFLNRLKKAISL